MTLAALEPHPHAAAVLGAAAAGSPSHAYLLHGPAGSGKRAAARAVAAELLARGVPDPENARTRVAHGTHPDLTWVSPSGALAAPRRAVQQVRVRGRPGGRHPEHGCGVRMGLQRGEGHGPQGNVPRAWNGGA